MNHCNALKDLLMLVTKRNVILDFVGVENYGLPMFRDFIDKVFREYMCVVGIMLNKELFISTNTYMQWDGIDVCANKRIMFV